ncbi:MAG: hypothetical protein U1F15_06680 [Burkholderiales bacterium]
MPPSSDAPSRAPADDRAERLFGGAVFVASAAALAAYVAVFGRNVPYFEDWTLVPVLAGAQAWSVPWLTEVTVAEHRFPLAKLALYPLWTASGGDFRSALWLDAVIVVAVSLACMIVARRLRGRAAFADAFFPLTLLNVGHSENTLFFAQLFFVAPFALLMAVLLVVAAGRWPGRTGWVGALALALVLLPGNGGIGMLVAPVLALWYAYAAWTMRTRPDGGRRDARILAAAVVATAVLCALYFVGWHSLRPPVDEPRTWQRVAETAAQAASLALGGGGRDFWRGLGPAVVVLGLATAAGLVGVARRRDDERLRATGLLACLAAAGAMALAIGIGRANAGPGAGLPARYALLMAPALVCVFFAAVLYGGRGAGRFVQVLLFAAACALIVPNAMLGVEYGRFRADLADAVTDDIEAGVPPRALAQRYLHKLLAESTDLEARFAMLEAARWGPFAGVSTRDAGAAPREIAVPVTIVGTHDVVVSDGVIRGVGSDPYVVLTLTKRAYVVGIRVGFTLETPQPGRARLHAYWMNSGRNNFDPVRRNAIVEVPSSPDPQSATFWVHDTVDHLRLDPDTGASVFRITDVVLLAGE